MGKLKYTLLTILFFSFFSLNVSAQKNDDLYKKAISEIQETLKLYLSEFPGVSLAIAYNGNIIWSDYLGYANLEYKIPTSNKTKFRVYSIAKTWTAIGLILLAEKGYVNIDAPVQKYVPSFPKKKYEITPRQLAIHTSGIRHYRDDDEAKNCSGCETVEEALNLFKKDSLLFKPGTQTLYSSWGYVLLSAVIENASGKEYLQFMQSEIFNPLNMQNTVYDNPANVIPNRSGIYTKEGRGKFKNVICSDPTCKWGAGGFLSTSEDIAKSIISLLSGDIISKESAKIILHPDKDGISIINGEGAGGRAQIWANLNKNLVIVFVGNAEGKSIRIQSFAEKISKLL